MENSIITLNNPFEELAFAAQNLDGSISRYPLEGVSNDLAQNDPTAIAVPGSIIESGGNGRTVVVRVFRPDAPAHGDYYDNHVYYDGRLLLTLSQCYNGYFLTFASVSDNSVFFYGRVYAGGPVMCVIEVTPQEPDAIHTYWVPAPASESPLPASESPLPASESPIPASELPIPDFKLPLPVPEKNICVVASRFATLRHVWVIYQQTILEFTRQTEAPFKTLMDTPLKRTGLGDGRMQCGIIGACVHPQSNKITIACHAVEPPRDGRSSSCLLLLFMIDKDIDGQYGLTLLGYNDSYMLHLRVEDEGPSKNKIICGDSCMSILVTVSMTGPIPGSQTLFCGILNYRVLRNKNGSFAGESHVLKAEGITDLIEARWIGINLLSTLVVLSDDHNIADDPFLLTYVHPVSGAFVSAIPPRGRGCLTAPICRAEPFTARGKKIAVHFTGYIVHRQAVEFYLSDVCKVSEADQQNRVVISALKEKVRQQAAMINEMSMANTATNMTHISERNSLKSRNVLLTCTSAADKETIEDLKRQLADMIASSQLVEDVSCKLQANLRSLQKEHSRLQAKQAASTEELQRLQADNLRLKSESEVIAAATATSATAAVAATVEIARLKAAAAAVADANHKAKLCAKAELSKLTAATAEISTLKATAAAVSLELSSKLKIEKDLLTETERKAADLSSKLSELKLEFSAVSAKLAAEELKSAALSVKLDTTKVITPATLPCTGSCLTQINALSAERDYNKAWIMHYMHMISSLEHGKFNLECTLANFNALIARV